MDLAVLNANSGSSAIDVFYGDGGGGFVDAGSLATTPTGAQGLLAAPLEGAPYPSLVVAEAYATGQVAIYPNSAGMISLGQEPGVTASPAAMCAAGFRTLGTSDVAVLDNAGGGLTVVLNVGGGAFRATTPFTAPQSATALTATELPFSTLPMLAVTGDNGSNGLIQLYASLTDGGFSTGPSVNVSHSPAAITAYRRSGATADTLVTASGQHGTIDVTVITDAGLTLSASYPAGQKANALATGDFNGDTLTDLAVTDPNSGNVYILYGQCK